MSEVELVIEGLRVGYGSSTILTDVNLECRSGEIVGIVGPNGAGKSTLLRGISGMANCSGLITWDGEKVIGMPAHRIYQRGIAHVPEGRHVFSDLTVHENLEIGFRGSKNRADRQSLRSMVHELFPILEERRSQQAGTLSGGEQQMLVIGRALMGNPRLLMIDEPSLGLAPLVVSTIYQAFDDLRRRGLAMILVEATLSHLAKVADELVVLQDGRIVDRRRGEEGEGISLESGLRLLGDTLGGS